MSEKKFDDLMKDVPMLYPSSENFEDELAFAVWSTHSSSDHRSDRDRPYDGQAHTDDGLRGKQLVSGLTMRDIRDCLIKAFLLSSPSSYELWSEKVEKGTWRIQDVCKIATDFNPLVVCRNLTCEIEKMMGIYPNVPMIESDGDDLR